MENKCKRISTRYLGVILLAGLLSQVSIGQQTVVSKPGPDGSPTDKKEAPTGTPATSVVVLKIGTTQITRAEIESLLNELPQPSTHGALTPEGRRRLVELYIRMVLLSQQATNDHLDASPVLRHRLEMQRTKLLAQAEYDKMRSDVKVTPAEIAQYYADHQREFDTVQVRQFIVRKRPKDAEASDAGLSAEDARAKAELIRKALASGDSPEKVNEDYGSSDVLLIDPRPRTLKRNEMIPALEKASFDAKDGEATGPVETSDADLVVLVLNHGHVTQQEATSEIEKKLRSEKLDVELDDLKKKSGVWMSDDYFKMNSAANPPSQAPIAAPTPKP